MFQDEYRRIEQKLQSITGRENVELTDGGDHADLASTIAFTLAREQRRPPVQIAREIADQMRAQCKGDAVTVEALGPYLNFHFGAEYMESILREALRPAYGSLPSRDERVVVEHTSANPNGPLHVGHIRNSVLGDTLARSFRKAGYRLETQYYVNDIGRQIAIVVWGLGHLGQTKKEEKSDHYIARVYIRANRAIEADPGITAQIDELMQRVELGDPEVVRQFREAVSDCLEGIRATLLSLMVQHDRFIWESDFIRNGDVTRTIARIRGMPQSRDDGTLWIDLSSQGFEKRYILMRSDGTTVYAARDIAFHLWKGRNFDRMIDVLGADHKLIGAQLIATLNLMGEKAPEILHFEFVSLPEGSMSTRAGKFVSADELVDEVVKQAYVEVTKRRPELEEEIRWAIARSVAVGAIRYDIVRVSPDKSTIFDWKEALDFERQSGPYIQYAHARACSILEKSGEFTPAFHVADPHEIALVKHIGRFPSVIEQVVKDLRPHHLAAYARDLADLFNAFYRYVPVLKSEETVRQSRLTLVYAARNTLKEALETLGIDALPTM